MAVIQARTRRPRDPQATRTAILEASCSLLAKDGPEGISLSQVATLAGVNRGTAYQHFETREKLIEETIAWVSDQMFRAVLGDPAEAQDREVEKVDMAEVTVRLSYFAMENPELCRIWLLQILSAPNPSSDPFWREFSGSIGRFAATDLAQPNIDVEVYSILTLAGTFLWPVWARSHAHDEEGRKDLAKRFAKETLRLALYGTVKPEKQPELTDRIDAAYRKSDQ